MQVSFNCPNCSNILQADPSWSGQKTQCPYCKSTFTIPVFSSTESPQLINQNINASPTVIKKTGSKEFFLLRLFNALLDFLRRRSIFRSLGKIKNVLIKIGAICYIILGILLFVVSGIISSDASSTWSAIFQGLTLMVGLIVFPVSGMYIFKIYDKLFEKSESYGIPGSFLNSIAIISGCACLYYMIWGITETCVTDQGLVPLYKNFRLLFISFPVFIASIAPDCIRISINEQSEIEDCVGISYFIARTTLFVIPFLWFYDVAYRILHMTIHLGAERSKFVEAFAVSSKDLPAGILYPIYFYLGYLVFNFVICAIEKLVVAKKQNK